MPPNQDRLTDREKAWLLIKQGGPFTLRELVEKAPIDYENVQSLVRSLVLSGIVRELKASSSYKKVYRYAEAHSQMTSVGALPRLPVEVSKRRKDWRQEVWNAIRILHRFEVGRLMLTLTVDVRRDTVYRYVRELVEAGFLSTCGRRVTRNGLSEITYALREVVGPRRPTTAGLELRASQVLSPIDVTSIGTM